MSIFLVGYRCTGKTTVAKVLSNKLGLKFVDTDQMITTEVGLDIAEFVARRGWGAFREKEKEVISKLSQLDGQVVATGGGVVTVPENLTTMRSSGTVIWLQASPATSEDACGRSRTATNRPSLTGTGALEEIERGSLLKGNRLYERAAQHFIDTEAERYRSSRRLQWLHQFRTRKAGKPA